MALEAVNTRIKVVQPAIPPSSHPNPIDAFIERDLRQSGSRVPALVDDAVFARRVYFDLIGLPPDPRELTASSASGQPNKRELLVDELLNRRDAYAEHWMSLLERSAPQRGRRRTAGRKARVDHALAVRCPEKQHAVRPHGAGVAAPERPDAPRGFLAGINWGGDVSASQSPAMQAAQNSAQVFLGANLRCASCHDSFVSRWKLNQTFGLAAYFTTDRLEIARCDIKTGASAAPAFLFPELRESEPAAELAERRRAGRAHVHIARERTVCRNPGQSLLEAAFRPAPWWSRSTTSKRRPGTQTCSTGWPRISMANPVRSADASAAHRDFARLPDGKRYRAGARQGRRSSSSFAGRSAGGSPPSSSAMPSRRLRESGSPSTT